MKTYQIIGLMSGTSLDGLDICYAAFNYPNYKFRIIEAETIPYEQEWKSTLANSIHLSSKELLKLHSYYGFYLGEKVNSFCEKHQIRKLDCIASHGHTIFHNPKHRYTLQIGHGAAIAFTTGFQTVCDFRSQDVLLGGQGAPLVPIGDELLFHNHDACLNLGGFSNISYKKDNKRIAFDICPVNIVLNYITRKDGLEFDLNGNLAKKGKPIDSLLKKLNQLEYFSSPFPKSLGLEWCLQYIFPLIEDNEESKEDLLATFVSHISEQITKTINENQLKTVLVTGGGAKNTFLLELIQSQISAKIILPENNLIDYKEALIFAFLGMLRLENQPNILSSVTGASKDHCSGIIFNP